MTMTLKIDLDVVKMYLHTKNEVPMWSSSKVIVWTDRQTDTTKNITYPHSQVVNMSMEMTHTNDIAMPGSNVNSNDGVILVLYMFDTIP